MKNNTKSTTRNWRDFVVGLNLELNKIRSTGAPAVNDADFVPVEGDDFYRVCRDGERTQRLVRVAGSLTRNGLQQRKVLDLLLALNHDKNEPPLDEEKVRETVASIARTHARNCALQESSESPLFDLHAASVGAVPGSRSAGA